MTRYTYLGDKLTDASLVGAQCEPVKRADGKCICGKGAMLVLFEGEKAPRVVVRRRLRINKSADV